jgi:DNA-binding HxlR family transcriptional regulator
MKWKVTMKQIDSVNQTLCPIARAETVVGDRWTVLALRELFMGSHRFEEIQAQSEGTPQMIAARLKMLEAEGLVERQLPAGSKRHEYHLTEKGEGFYPVILALRAWGETWCKTPDQGRAINYTHQICGGPAGLGPVCESCGLPMKLGELTAVLNPDYRDEREARLQTFKDGRRRASS